MAAKNSSPALRFGDWEDEDVDEFLSSECQEGGRFANLQDTDLNKIVTESYSKSTKANTKRAAKVFQGKYSDIEIHFRLQNSIKNGFDCCRQVSWRSVCSFRSAHARKSAFFLIICISMLYSKPNRRWFSYIL